MRIRPRRNGPNTPPDHLRTPDGAMHKGVKGGECDPDQAWHEWIHEYSAELAASLRHFRALTSHWKRRKYSAPKYVLRRCGRRCLLIRYKD